MHNESICVGLSFSKPSRGEEARSFASAKVPKPSASDINQPTMWARGGGSSSFAAGGGDVSPVNSKPLERNERVCGEESDADAHPDEKSGIMEVIN